MPDEQTTGTATVSHTPVDWHSWLRRWDVQQTGYLPDREARFTAMFDVLEALLPDEFIALVRSVSACWHVSPRPAVWPLTSIRYCSPWGGASWVLRVVGCGGWKQT